MITSGCGESSDSEARPEIQNPRNIRAIDVNNEVPVRRLKRSQSWKEKKPRNKWLHHAHQEFPRRRSEVETRPKKWMSEW